VGGDHFDFIKLDETRLGIVVADVSGKGVTGALVVAMCHSIVTSQAAHHTEAAQALKEFRRLLVDDIPEDRFITMLYGVLDTVKREFSFARAGHEPLLVYRAETRTVERVAPKGGAIGLHRGERFDRILTEETVPLALGDCLVLFTDGLLEAANEEGDEFGMARLKKVVEENASLDVQDLEDVIFTKVESFASDRPQVDDQTLVVVKMT
jgi:sigma-B regulation protein RsbU (phosphoserine phosphatase)